jgi:hypothetical protein
MPISFWKWPCFQSWSHISGTCPRHVLHVQRCPHFSRDTTVYRDTSTQTLIESHVLSLSWGLSPTTYSPIEPVDVAGSNVCIIVKNKQKALSILKRSIICLYYTVNIIALISSPHTPCLWSQSMPSTRYARSTIVYQTWIGFTTDLPPTVHVLYTFSSSTSYNLSRSKNQCAPDVNSFWTVTFEVDVNFRVILDCDDVCKRSRLPDVNQNQMRIAREQKKLMQTRRGSK